MSTYSADKVQQFIVRPRGKPIKHLPSETYAKSTDHASDLYDRIAAKSRMDINRLRITKGSDGSLIPNTKDVTIDQVGIYEQSSIFVKDLGPQIAWRTVFLVEYLGPLLIHPLFYMLRAHIYRNPNVSHAITLSKSPRDFPPPSLSLVLSTSMLILHFAKRELETLFVHRFSSATMPVFNIFKNSAHYWLLGGLNIALFTNSPWPYCPTSRDPDNAWMLPLAVLLFVVGEAGNFAVHMNLRSLRTQGGKERGIPDGLAFRLVPVTCPNYFFEMIAWIGISLANRSLSTVLFAVVAMAQMAVWARKKEARYRREFGDKYRRRRAAMIPYII